MLGKALKALGVLINAYIVSTKCGRYVEGFDFSAERGTKSIDESLERLQLDYVDILQCHDIEFGSVNQGFHWDFTLMFWIGCHRNCRRSPVLLSYGINDSTLEDLLLYLKSGGVGVISASPLAMSLLTKNGPP